MPLWSWNSPHVELANQIPLLLHSAYNGIIWGRNMKFLEIFWPPDELWVLIKKCMRTDLP